MTNDLTQFVRERWAKAYLARLRSETRTRQFMISTLYDQGDMTDLEFRLYYGIPANIFYKARKNKIRMAGCTSHKWRRWGRTG